MNRRDRKRARTMEEIKDIGRRQLAADGVGGVSLRAIAREMGMTAPALYRYFASHDDVVKSMVGDYFGEVCAALTAARDGAPDDARARLVEISRALRRWAVGHPTEFGLMFSHVDADQAPRPVDAGERSVGRIVLAAFVELWREQPFDPRGDAALDPRLIIQLETWRDQIAGELPAGALLVVLGSWLHLYSLISMEVFGQMRFVLTDPEPFFESQLAEIVDRVAVTARERAGP